MKSEDLQQLIAIEILFAHFPTLTEISYQFSEFANFLLLKQGFSVRKDNRNELLS